MKTILLKPLLIAAVTAFASFPAKVQANAVTSSKLLESFEVETSITRAKLNHATATLTNQGAIEGNKALRVTFSPPASYPGFSFPIAAPLDWTGFGGLALDVTNPGAEPISFALRIDSALGSDGKKNSRTGGARVEAGKTVTLLMPFNVEMESPDMSTLPGYKLMNDNTGGWNPFNLKNIVMMQIFTSKPPVERVLLFDNLRLVPALPPVPAPPLKTETKPVLSFESDAEIQSIKTSHGSTLPVTQGATDGKRALRFKLEPTSQWPNVSFPLSSPQDWRGYGGLAFDLTNPTSEAFRFGVRIDTTQSASGGGGERQGGGTVEPGQTVSFLFPFGIDAAALGMKSLPGLGGFRSTGAGGGGKFDLGKIATWQIFGIRPTSPIELIIDNARLVPGQKQDFNNIIDKFGQYTRADWPGKIKSEADLAAQKTAEDADLKKQPASATFNKYGGWANGPQLQATGFFRAEKYNGKWSLVDPEGRLFLSFGPTTITPSAATVISGREYMFNALPKDDALLNQHVVNEKGDLNFLGANLQRKYGEDYKKLWLDHTYDRLRSWGFNTVAGFSSWDTLNNGKVPYTATVWALSGHTRTALDGNVSHTQADPFDPRFASSVFGAARGQALKIKNDPYFLGYFVGNEEHWGHWRNGPRSHYGLVLGALKAKAANSPAKRAFLAQLQQKYSDIGKVNAAWSTNYADWNAMNESLTFGDKWSDGLRSDFSALLTSYAEQYFRVVQGELKKLDPNHLYLGCRFAGHSPEVVQAAAKYSDVLSFNIYRLKVDSKELGVLDNIDRPVVIGEFHFGATDRGMFDPGLVGVADQTARGRAYQDYVRSVLAEPLFVGAHWFQYTDQPTTARALDTENSNCGLVSIADTPYPELINAARQIHAQMYPLRFRK